MKDKLLGHLLWLGFIALLDVSPYIVGHIGVDSDLREYPVSVPCVACSVKYFSIGLFSADLAHGHGFLSIRIPCGTTRI